MTHTTRTSGIEKKGNIICTMYLFPSIRLGIPLASLFTCGLELYKGAEIKVPDETVRDVSDSQ